MRISKFQSHNLEKHLDIQHHTDNCFLLTSLCMQLGIGNFIFPQLKPWETSAVYNNVEKILIFKNGFTTVSLHQQAWAKAALLPCFFCDCTFPKNQLNFWISTSKPFWLGSFCDTLPLCAMEKKIDIFLSYLVWFSYQVDKFLSVFFLVFKVTNTSKVTNF